jgi:hypothetical protein
MSQAPLAFAVRLPVPRHKLIPQYSPPSHRPPLPSPSPLVTHIRLNRLLRLPEHSFPFSRSQSEPTEHDVPGMPFLPRPRHRSPTVLSSSRYSLVAFDRLSDELVQFDTPNCALKTVLMCVILAELLHADNPCTTENVPTLHI